MTKYAQIVKSITRDIFAGKYLPLETIPSERALMARFGAARETVRKALDVLDEQRLIYRRHGRPTVVSDRVIGAKTKIGIMISGCMRTEIYRVISETIVKLAENDHVETVLGDVSRRDFDNSGMSAYKVAREMVAKGIQGVILEPIQCTAAADEINRNLVEIFRRAGVAVVLIDCDVVRRPDRGEFDLVGIDNYNAGRLAAEHAIAQGARQIVFVARRGCADTVHQRWYGVRSVSDRVTVEGLYLKSISDYRQIREGLETLKEMDTLICQNDVAALNIMTVLREMKLRIPEDVMVIGFDDVVLAGKSNPGLTSVHQPCGDIAEQAYRRLLARIANPQLTPVSIQCRETLTARGTTDRDWAKKK